MTWTFTADDGTATLYAPSGTDVTTVDLEGGWSDGYPDELMKPALEYTLEQTGNLNFDTAIAWLGQLIVGDIEQGNP